MQCHGKVVSLSLVQLPDNVWTLGSTMPKFSGRYTLTASYTDGQSKTTRNASLSKLVNPTPIDQFLPVCKHTVAPAGILHWHHSLAGLHYKEVHTVRQCGVEGWESI